MELAETHKELVAKLAIYLILVNVLSILFDVGLWEPKIKQINLHFLIDTEGAFLIYLIKILHLKRLFKNHIVWFHIWVQVASLVHAFQAEYLYHVRTNNTY